MFHRATNYASGILNIGVAKNALYYDFDFLNRSRDQIKNSFSWRGWGVLNSVLEFCSELTSGQVVVALGVCKKIYPLLFRATTD